MQQLDEDRTALEAHVPVSERDLAVTDLKERFGINHATLEFELSSQVHRGRELFQDR